MRNQFGVDFGRFDEDWVRRQICRRMRINDCATVEGYEERVLQDLGEAQALHDDLLLRVSDFIRNPDTLKSLKEEVFRQLVAKSHGKDILRLWVAGCSTGEEVYSLCFLLDETITEEKANCDFKVFATDMDIKALRIAGLAVYPNSQIEGLPRRWQENYIYNSHGKYQVSTRIRERIVFAKHNAFSDAPFPDIDLISCRLLTKNMKASAQAEVFQKFHFSMQNTGFLLTDQIEDLPGRIDGFEPIRPGASVYRSIQIRKVVLQSTEGFEASGRISTADKGVTKKAGVEPGITNYETEIYKTLVDRVLPPSIIFDEEGRLKYTLGGSDRLFIPWSGKASIDLNNLLPEALYEALFMLWHQASDEDAQVSSGEITCRLPGEPVESKVRVVVRNMGMKQGALHFYAEFIVQDVRNSELVSEISRDDAKVYRLQSELDTLKEGMADTNFEMTAVVNQLEATIEELKASNEQLQVRTEELQSSNEELQALNEELISVNAEFRSRIDQPNDIKWDIHNALGASEIGTLVLDPEMRIRQFNSYSQAVFRFLSSDVGRSIEDFTSRFEASIAQMARKALRSRESWVQEVLSKEGDKYLMRIGPYRTERGKVEGVLLILFATNNLQSAASHLKQGRENRDKAQENGTELIVRFNFDGNLVFANRKFCREVFNSHRVDFSHRNFSDFLEPADRRSFAAILRKCHKNRLFDENIDLGVVAGDGSRVPVRWQMRSHKQVDFGESQILALGRRLN